jgi:hypothetical protein
MKLRHAAALALTGWYLIAPPAPGTKPVPPLYKWVRLHEFDTAAQCKQWIRMQKTVPSKDAVVKWGCMTNNGDYCPPSATDTEQSWERCVASDDPRLKPK